MLKFLAGCMGRLFAGPYLIGYHLGRGLLGAQRALAMTSESVARVPGLIGVYTRQAFYRRTLATVGRDVHFGFMSLFSRPEAIIGDRVYIGRFCIIGRAHIGDDVMLADSVQVLSGRHQHGSDSHDGRPLRENAHRYVKVTIGQGAWIGAGAIVMADVGPRAVVGAGAVVVKPIPPGAKVAGVPAKPLNENHTPKLARSA